MSNPKKNRAAESYKAMQTRIKHNLARLKSNLNRHHLKPGKKGWDDVIDLGVVEEKLTELLEVI